jgi:hypothetical protein
VHLSGYLAPIQQIQEWRLQYLWWLSLLDQFCNPLSEHESIVLVCSYFLALLVFDFRTDRTILLHVLNTLSESEGHVVTDRTTPKFCWIESANDCWGFHFGLYSFAFKQLLMRLDMFTT